jgi:hypothetical protein
MQWMVYTSVEVELYVRVFLLLRAVVVWSPFRPDALVSMNRRPRGCETYTCTFRNRSVAEGDCGTVKADNATKMATTVATVVK